MHYLKVTALASALATLAFTSPLPDHAVVRRDRAVVEGADSLEPDMAYKQKRDRAVIEGADDLEPDMAYKQKRDRAVIEGADDLEPDMAYRKAKRGTYSKYENNGPYVPMSKELEV